MKRVAQKSVKRAVKERYAQLARGPTDRAHTSPAFGRPSEGIARRIGYTNEDLSDLPQGVVATSLGCGNPLAFIGLRDGDVVLDLGSGAGMDAILAARRVGHRGRVIGVDMTPEMVEKAREHVKEAGVEDTVEIRRGEMENLPLEEDSVDWVISNCSINLSVDKEAVFREAYRVLKPGGRMLVSDLVSSDAASGFKGNLAAWTRCVAGTLEEGEYLKAIAKAGFAGVAVVDRTDFTEAFRSMARTEETAPDSEKFQMFSIKVEAMKAEVGGTGKPSELPDAVSGFRAFLEGKGIRTAKVPDEGLRYIMMSYDAGDITLEDIADSIKRGKRPCPPEPSETGCGCSGMPGGSP